MSDTDTKRYWRSLGELEGSAEFRQWLEREFPEGAADAPDGITRRTMLQLVGASLSLAGLAACRRPVENIVPYVNAPEEIVPGVPLRYATTMPFGVNGLGLVVESHEGRPTKVEGNELHPATLGAASAWVQGEIYQLYDPDRAREVLYQNFTSTWAKFLDWWKTQHAGLAADQGASLAVVLEPFSSPTRARLVTELKRTFPRARVVAYAPLGDENVYAGIAAASGAVHEPVYHFDKARVIVSLDADFLLDDRDSVRQARGFAEGRRSGDAMNRLYVVESALTITGIAADHRLRLQSRQIGAFAAALGAELGVGSAGGAAGGFDAKWIKALARDLKANAGKSLIIAGRSSACGGPCRRRRVEWGSRQRRQHRDLRRCQGDAAVVDRRVEAARRRHAGGQDQDVGGGGRQSGVRRPRGLGFRRARCRRSKAACASARTSTRLPRSATGTSPKRISSRPGATLAAWPDRSPWCSR